jgi:hypothetical protein
MEVGWVTTGTSPRSGRFQASSRRVQLIRALEALGFDFPEPWRSAPRGFAPAAVLELSADSRSISLLVAADQAHAPSTTAVLELIDQALGTESEDWVREMLARRTDEALATAATVGATIEFIDQHAALITITAPAGARVGSGTRRVNVSMHPAI